MNIFMKPAYISDCYNRVAVSLEYTESYYGLKFNFIASLHNYSERCRFKEGSKDCG